MIKTMKKTIKERNSFRTDIKQVGIDEYCSPATTRHCKLIGQRLIVTRVTSDITIEWRRREEFVIQFKNAFYCF